jgi:hypothetical protein
MYLKGTSLDLYMVTKEDSLHPDYRMNLQNWSTDRGYQENLSNHLTVLLSMDKGVERIRKRGVERNTSGVYTGAEWKWTDRRGVETYKDSVRNRGNLACPGKSTGVTWEIDGPYWHSAFRQQELYKGLIMELWKSTDDVKSKRPKRRTVRLKVEKHQLVADEAVVVRKFL